MQEDRTTRFTSKEIGLGKLPPQDVDIENVVIGAMLLDPSSIVMVSDILRPEIFYDPRNQKICEAILKLHKSSNKIDILTVTSALRISGQLEEVGGAYYITELTSRVTGAGNIEDHIMIVYRFFLLREQIRIYTEGINACYDQEDPIEMIISTTNQLGELHAGIMTTNEVSTHELATQAIKDRETGRKETLGLSTGFQHLDKAISGYQPGQLIVIAGRPGMGKTAFAISILKAIGMESRKPVAMFSMEMTAMQLYIRLQASCSGIESKKIRFNNLSDRESSILFQTDGTLSNCPIYIDDTPALNIHAFRAKATIMKHRYGIKAIVVDYLQLAKSPKKGGNREAEISDISGTMKQVAKELGIPVIALSQLSRDVEKRAGNKIPMLSDLRESGSIEQDADMVGFLFRPEYYEITEAIGFRHFGVDIQTKGLLAFVIAKQRDGDTYNIPLKINLSNMIITDHPVLIKDELVKTQTGIDFKEAEITAEQTPEGDVPF